MPYLGRQPGVGVRNRYIYTATASQTTFSGADDNGATLAYDDAAYVDVYLNGVLLIPVTDYAATTKTSVVLTSGAAASDLLEILAYEISSIADTVSKANGGTFDGAITVNGNFSADGGTIKLDGNHPVGTNNVALGNTALDSNVSGASNTAIGADALTANTASNNTAVGYQSLYTNSTGFNNNGFGGASLLSNTTGNYNAAFGNSSLRLNTTGASNTAFGVASLQNNTTASNNTAVGYQALYDNTTAERNTAVGRIAAANTTTGADNTVMGSAALTTNTTGANNVAIGASALRLSTTSSNNTAVGYEAGYNLSTNSGNVFVGYLSGQATTSPQNTFIGSGSGYLVSSGQKNTIIGTYSGNQNGLDIRTSSNNIVLSDGDGNPRAFCNSSGYFYFNSPNGSSVPYSGSGGQIVINNTFGVGVYNVSSIVHSTGGQGHIVFINNNGNVGSINTSGSSTSYNTSSDYRLKENVVELTGATDRLKQLNPSRFNFIADPDTTVDGFLAHEVQAIVPEAVTGEKDAVDADGNIKPQGIDQSKLVPLLVATIKELEARITALETN